MNRLKHAIKLRVVIRGDSAPSRNISVLIPEVAYFLHVTPLEAVLGESSLTARFVIDLEKSEEHGRETQLMRIKSCHEGAADDGGQT